MIERRAEGARRAASSSTRQRPGILPLIGDGLLPPRHRRQAEAEERRAGADRRHAGRRRPVRGDVRRAQHLGARRAVERDAGSRRSRSRAQLPVAAFDSIFPCAPTSRDCLPQPGITDPDQYLDILSYRQRPTWRLAYRNFKDYESMVTNQSVEALPGIAGMRWYEIRRDGRHLLALPAGHVRARRRRAPLDGLDRAGQERQHGPRLQRRQRHRRVPGHPLHGPPRRRPARADDAGRRRDHQRHRRADDARTRAGATTRR